MCGRRIVSKLAGVVAVIVVSVAARNHVGRRHVSVGLLLKRRHNQRDQRPDQLVD